MLIDQPEDRDSYGPGESIKLNAAVSGGHKIDLFAGIRWTLGSTEPSRYCVEDAFDDGGCGLACEQDEQALEQTSLIRSVHPNPQATPYPPSTGIYPESTGTVTYGGAYNKIEESIYRLANINNIRTTVSSIHHMPPACLTRHTKLAPNGNVRSSQDRSPSIIIDTDDHELTRSFKGRYQQNYPTNYVSNYLKNCSLQEFQKLQQGDVVFDLSKMPLNKKNMYQSFIDDMVSYTKGLTDQDVCP
ncbi:MAG: hypothetical protein HC921_20695 [Synechococcaceae cyanobacterium SM2_3_1]|nr:hypothetical protein [Synechococcaceae cyanobacterium SM2_3_1]